MPSPSTSNALAIADLRPPYKPKTGKAIEELGDAQRLFIAGMTGCGKTTLARELLRGRKHVVVYDWKGNIHWPGYRRYTTLKECVRAGNAGKITKIIYAPNKAELRDPEMHEAFFRWVYERGNCTLYIDEVSSVTTNNDIPDGYKDCLVRGREQGVETVSSSQRPTGIPQWILSEAERFYVFRLQMAQDREKIAETISLVNDEKMTPMARRREGDARLKKLPKRYFYFYVLGDDAPAGPLKVTLPEAKAA